MKPFLKWLISLMAVVTLFTLFPSEKAEAGGCSSRQWTIHNGVPYRKDNSRIGIMSNTASSLSNMASIPVAIEWWKYSPTDSTDTLNAYGWSGWTYDSQYWAIAGEQDAQNYTYAPNGDYEWQPYWVDGLGWRFGSEAGNYNRYRRPVNGNFYKDITVPDTVAPSVQVDGWNPDTNTDSNWKNSDPWNNVWSWDSGGCNSSTWIRTFWSTSTNSPSDAQMGTYNNTGGLVATKPNSPSGIYYLWVQSGDDSGNWVIHWYGPFKVDKDAPTQQNFAVRGMRYTSGTDYWVRPNDSVTFTLRGTDAHSGLNYSYLQLLQGTEDIRVNHDWNSSTGDNFNYFLSDPKVQFTKARRTYNSGGVKEVEFDAKIIGNGVNYDIKPYYSDYVTNFSSMLDSGYNLRSDGTAPNITFSGVADGQIYAGVTVTPVINVTDNLSGLKTQSASLKRTNNGITTTAPFTSGTSLVDSGEYELTVDAEDNVGNIVSNTIRFRISKAPTFTLNLSDSFVYPLKPTLSLNSTTSSDRNEAVLTLHYQVRETKDDGSEVLRNNVAVSSVSRNVSNVWDTSTWSLIDLTEPFVTNLTDGRHVINFWVEDEYGAKSAVVSPSFNVDSAEPKFLKLNHLANGTTQVALNSSIRFSINAEDPVPKNQTYLQRNEVRIEFEIRKNGTLLVPQPPMQVRLNQQPTKPITLFLGQSNGYKVNDVITISAKLDDQLGNRVTTGVLATVTIK